MSQELSGKITLLTGASQGLGRGIALALAQAGSHLILVSRTMARLTEVSEEARSFNVRAEPLELDVTDESAVRERIGKALEEFGRIDNLVNNAGLNDDHRLVRMKATAWDQVMKVNLYGVYSVTRAVLRQMIRNDYGRIVNIASIAGETGNPGQANYAASKAGIIGFTKSVAQEVAAKNVTVNAVSPGVIDAGMTERLPEREAERLLHQIPKGRLGTVEEIAHGVIFLLSPKASYVTGQVLSINGGLYM